MQFLVLLLQNLNVVFKQIDVLSHPLHLLFVLLNLLGMLKPFFLNMLGHGFFLNYSRPTYLTSCQIIAVSSDKGDNELLEFVL